MTERELDLREQEVLEKGLLQFRTFDDHVRNALINNELIFGAAKNFNDPFDCNLPIDLDNVSIDLIKDYIEIENIKYALSEVEINKRAKDYFDNKAKFEKEIRNVINNYRRFSCFQIVTTNKTHKDIFFWANYADKHKGICLKFNGKIIDAKNHFEGIVRSLPIEYINCLKKIPEFNYLKYRIEKFKLGYDRAKELNGNRGASEYFFGIKSTKWKYENEVRFVSESLSMPFLEPYVKLKFNPSMLEKVYIGCNASLSTVNEVFKIMHLPKFSHVEVIKLVRDNKRFKLLEEKLK